MAFMSLSPAFLSRASSAENFPVAPCSFPFDAAHRGISVRERFVVTKERNYFVSLFFHHTGGEGAKKLAELIDADEALFTAESIRLGQPVRVTSDDFMEQKSFSSIHEKNAALTTADSKYMDAVHTAINSRFTNQQSEFAFLPRNTKGVIPISIELVKIDGTKITNVLERKTFDTNGTDGGGSERLSRVVTGATLSPGLYEVHVETLRDSPLFFDVPITLAITYRPKI